MQLTSKVKNFFEGEDIPGPGRMKVLYARAYTLSLEEVRAAIAHNSSRHQWRLDRLVSLKAPKVIIDNERRLLKRGDVTKLLQKVLADLS